MINKNSRLVIALVQVLAGAQILLPLSASAGISNLPPLVKSSVPPNVFYTLDDSGSMMFEVIPDNLAPTGNSTSDAGRTNIQNYYSGSLVMKTFPSPPDVYNVSGVGDYTSASVVGFSDNITVARWRSSVTNKIYYDPAVRYDPWIDVNTIDLTNPYGKPMPNADSTRAFFNPVVYSGGIATAFFDVSRTLNLTIEQPRTLFNRTWLNDAATGATTTPTWTIGGVARTTFYPATYFQYNPDNSGSCTTSALSCFKRMEIKPATVFPKKAAGRTDCKPNLNDNCTYEEEIQNFANWFQYYRSRILTARAGSARAFANQPASLRVGFGTLATAGTRLKRISDDFDVVNKKDFISTLYSLRIGRNGTPLRRAVDDIGQYFRDDSKTGPWQTKYNFGDVADQISCRQNYNILMTDGYWDNTGNAHTDRRSNWDATDGKEITAPNDSKYQYIKDKPYRDGTSNTLADIAMFYWVNELRPLWPKEKKNVPLGKNGSDPAFWQHLVQYTVGLGVTGSLDPATDLPLLTAGTKAWPPASATANQVDDLWHAAVNSRGKFFSASDPLTFSKALKDSLEEIADRSGDAAAIATSKNTLDVGLKLYTSTYQTGDWSGRLEQKPLNAKTGDIEKDNDWSTDGKILAPDLRNIVTTNTNGKGGAVFGLSALSGADQVIMNAAAVAYAPGSIVTATDVINYIRGAQDDTKPFRKRKQLLGDLVNSDPQYVLEGKDGGYIFMPSYIKGKNSYRKFLGTKLGRVPTVYVGSNDGMLHAFNASADKTAGGTERFAFIPQAVVPNLVELAKPSYVHRFYVDGTPMIADAAIGADPEPWKTVLVGTTGAGGKSVFALDVSSPGSFTKDNVMWEVSSTLPNVENDLGYTIGTPQIGLMKDGRWVAVFGNGFESKSLTAKLYVVELATGNVLYRAETGVGGVGSPNGLSTPKLRLAADSTIEAVYAGDLQGNLWKFDFSTSTVSGALKTEPKTGFGLFKAVNTARNQPITTQPQIYPHPNNGYMVLFGTGKIFEDSDPATKDLETLYGVWDKVISTKAAQADLVEQKLEIYNAVYYTVTNNPVPWSSKRGWFITMDRTAGERIVSDPIIFEDQVIFTTLIPSSSSDPCSVDGKSTTLQISPFNGAPLGYRTIDTDGNGRVESTDAMVSGRQSSATFGTTIVRLGNRQVKIFQADSKNGTILGGAAGIKGELSAPIPSVRLWRQIIGKE